MLTGITHFAHGQRHSELHPESSNEPQALRPSNVLQIVVICSCGKRAISELLRCVCVCVYLCVFVCTIAQQPVPSQQGNGKGGLAGRVWARQWPPALLGDTGDGDKSVSMVTEGGHLPGNAAVVTAQR